MKSELDSLRSWYVYNSNVRKKYLEHIFSKVPEEERYRDRGASFPSIVGIFMHVLDAYREWFLLFDKKVSGPKKLQMKRKYSKLEVARAERKIDTCVMNFVNTLRVQDLEKTAPVGYGNLRISLRGMLLHMIEDELQHRGEINALLWQLDISPPRWGEDDWTPRRNVG